MKVFLAHTKGEPALDGLVATLTTVLRRQVDNVRVVTGHQDYKNRFGAAGGWTAWAKSVGAGTVGGDPRYDAIVVPESVSIGRATAQIVQFALDARRLVVVWDRTAGEKPLKRVRALETIDPENWRAGWRLVVEAQAPPTGLETVIWDQHLVAGWQPVSEAPVGVKAEFITREDFRRLVVNAEQDNTVLDEWMQNPRTRFGTFSSAGAALWRPLDAARTAAQRREEQAQRLQAFVAACDTLIDDCRALCSSRSEAAVDFGFAIREKAESIRAWAAENGHYTPKMAAAIANMQAGVDRWL